jgi:hypothetical protein
VGLLYTLLIYVVIGFGFGIGLHLFRSLLEKSKKPKTPKLTYPVSRNDRIRKL